MQGLKALVIVLGVLIVVGLAFVVYGFFLRVSGPGSANEARFGDVTIALPEGARLLGGEASDGRLVVRLELADGTPRFIVVDLASGGVVGTVTLTGGR